MYFGIDEAYLRFKHTSKSSLANISKKDYVVSWKFIAFKLGTEFSMSCHSVISLIVWKLSQRRVNIIFSCGTEVSKKTKFQKANLLIYNSVPDT